MSFLLIPISYMLTMCQPLLETLDRHDLICTKALLGKNCAYLQMGILGKRIEMCAGSTLSLPC